MMGDSKGLDISSVHQTSGDMRDEVAVEVHGCIDLHGKILYISMAMENLTGFQAASCIGQPIMNYFMSERRCMLLWQHLKQHGVVRDFKAKCRCARGQITVIINARLVFDDKGKVVGCEGFMRDAAKRNQRKSEEIIIFANQNPSPVLRAERNGQLVYANKSSQMLLRALHAHVGGMLPREWQDWVAQVLRLRMARTVDVVCGHLVYACTFIPIDNYVNIYCNDVTGLKKNEDALRHEQQDLEERVRMRTEELVRANEDLKHAMKQAEEAERERQKMMLKMEHAQRLESLGVLAGGIAHDFNNLLSVILGNTTLLKRKLDADSNQHKYIQRIQAAGHSAAELCRQMLAYAGKGKTSMQRVMLPMMVEEIGQLLRSTISRSVQLEFKRMESVPSLEVDASQLRQVIMSLVMNAAESIGDGQGVVTVSTGQMRADEDYVLSSVGYHDAEPGDYAYLDIEDTGCGMDEATLQRVFDPFFSTKFAGRGLGMSAVLGIIQSHKGLIHVCSDVGVGTTFRILLPLPEIKMEKGIDFNLPIINSPKMPEEVLPHGTVLVADDEAEVREIACVMLEEMGYSTLEACDGEQAVQIFSEQANDIQAILLDETMPKMNGDKAIEFIRKIRNDIPVVLTSGHAQEDVEQLFSGTGVDCFIQKPYAQETLQQALHDAIARHKPAD